MCSDNIRGLYLLRSNFAIYYVSLQERMECERVLESEIEEARLLYNILDLIGESMCAADAMPSMSFEFESSFDAGPGIPSGATKMTFLNGIGETFQVQLTPAAGDGEAMADAVMLSIQFAISGGFSGIYEYFKHKENGVTIRMLNGSSLSYTTALAYPQYPATPESYILITGDTETSIGWEVGCMRECDGATGRLQRIIAWLTARVVNLCDKKVIPTNTGPCPPAEIYPCGDIPQTSFSILYYGIFGYNSPITEPSPSPTQNLHFIKIEAVAPVSVIEFDASEFVYLTDTTTGDQYQLQYVSSGANEGLYQVIAVLPDGQDEWVDTDLIQVDPNTVLSTSGSTIAFLTTKGNRCNSALTKTIYGTELVAFVPPAMLLTSLVMSGTKVVGEYDHECKPTPGASVKLYKDGVLQYEWIVDQDPLISFDGIEFSLEYPSKVMPLAPGTWTISWPQGWVENVYGSKASALSPGTYTYVVPPASSNNVFTFTLPATLS